MKRKQIKYIIADSIKVARDNGSRVPAVSFLRRAGMNDEQVEHILSNIFPLHDV